MRKAPLVLCLALGLSLATPAAFAQAPDGALPILDKRNLEKKRPKPPFNLTGTWTMQRDKANGDYEFLPLPKLTPAAQAEYDGMKKALAEGKAYKDDAALCWPAGMPRWLTRVWPIQMIQTPTAIIGIQGLFNSVRWIYLDGRPHADPEIAVPTYNGDSIGRWEGNTLVVDTTNLQPKRHWMQQGVPMSAKLHIVERIRMAKDGKSFTVELTMTDPDNWVGEWKNTKTFIPVTDDDVFESHCLPDINDKALEMQPQYQAR